MCLPTAFSILTDTMPAGKRRNIGFACLGLGQPFGFSVGLVLGGIFQSSTLGWRFGYYLCAGATFILAVLNFFKLPKDKPRGPFTLQRLRTEIDWIGILLSSSCLGIISYVFASVCQWLLILLYTIPNRNAVSSPTARRTSTKPRTSLYSVWPRL